MCGYCTAPRCPAGVDCGPNGACTPNLDVNHTCACQVGWAGASCQEQLLEPEPEPAAESVAAVEPEPAA
jgi:hypothetical protein